LEKVRIEIDELKGGVIDLKEEGKAQFDEIEFLKNSNMTLMEKIDNNYKNIYEYEQEISIKESYINKLKSEIQNLSDN